MVKKTVLHEWRDGHPSVKRWLSRLAKSTRLNYLRYLYQFFTWLRARGGEFAGVEPEEMLTLQEHSYGRNRYNQLDLLQMWLNSQKVRASTKLQMYSAVRSYYAHNRVELPRDKGFRVRSDKAPITSEMTREELRKIVLSCNEAYQAVFLVMFTSGMGSEEFTCFNENGWEQIKPQLEAGKKRLKVTLPGRKHARNQRPYFTFIAKDGVDALKKYLDTQRGVVKKGEAIILNERGNPVKRDALESYFTRHAQRVGIIRKWTPKCDCGGETRYVRKWTARPEHKPYVVYVCNECGKEIHASDIEVPDDIRYRVHPHEMRDLRTSEWEVSPAKMIVCEFTLGHDIDPNAYNKFWKLHPDWVEKQFALAEPHLNIITEEPMKVSRFEVTELRRELDQYREENRRLKERLNGLLETPLASKVEQLETRLDTLITVLERRGLATAEREEAKKDWLGAEA